MEVQQENSGIVILDLLKEDMDECTSTTKRSQDKTPGLGGCTSRYNHLEEDIDEEDLSPTKIPELIILIPEMQEFLQRSKVRRFVFYNKDSIIPFRMHISVK